MKTIPIGVSFLVLCAFPLPGSGNNGLNLIGFGIESIGIAGADIAVARDTSAINTNPAGLVQISEQRLDLQVARGFSINVRHRDQFDNNVEVANDPVLANFGFAQRLQNRPVTWGIGLFAQGGTGVEYPQLNTAFGTRDELSSLFRIAKLAGSVAFALSESLSFGVAIAATYSDIKQKVFPNTSADPFFGFELKDTSGVSPGVKLGFIQRLGPRLNWGATYTSEVKLKLDGGPLIADLSSIGLNKVIYRDAEVEGFELPQELGAGVAWRATQKWLLAAKVSWIDWSDAIDRSVLRARNPDDPAAPGVIELSAEHDWRDQIVLALGAIYEPNRKMMLRLGFNYGRNPIPRERTNPLLAAIGERHVTVGFGYRLGTHWQIDGAIEYNLDNTVTYTNPALPFGFNAEEESDFFTIHLGASRRW